MYSGRQVNDVRRPLSADPCVAEYLVTFDAEFELLSDTEAVRFLTELPGIVPLERQVYLCRQGSTLIARNLIHAAPCKRKKTSRDATVDRDEGRRWLNARGSSIAGTERDRSRSLYPDVY